MQKPLRYLVFLTLLFFVINLSFGQKQLVVLKKENILLRLYPGDEFIFTLKGSKKIRRSYVNNLNDTSVLAHNDIIPYHRIDRIYVKRSNLLNVIGGILVVGGIGYFVIDQVNVVLVHKEDANLNENVVTASAVMLAAGLPLILLKKKYVRIRGKYRVMTVEKGSGFYMPDLREDVGEE
jgi:hypothetical protein